MNNPIEAARARLAAIEEEAEKLRFFILSWEAVQDFLDVKVDAPATAEKVVDKTGAEADETGKTRTRALNPPTDTVVDAAIAILRQRGHPMTRRALHDALWQRGVEVRGRDPVKTLGTILWRANDRMIQLEGFGYWPKNLSYARANYLQPQTEPSGSLPFSEEAI